MNYRKPSCWLACGLLAVLCVIGSAQADDIDLYMGASGGTYDAPNIIFLIDNSPNWSRAAQHWPDNNGIQGAAEVNAISQVLASFTQKMPMNVGLALLTTYSGTTADSSTPGTGGCYIRFGVRDMTQPVNLAALEAVLTGIGANINAPTEKLSGMASKD